IAAGSAAVETGSGSAQVEMPPPQPPKPEPDPLPALVEIVFESTPKGALVVDAENPSVTFGKTPTTATVPGSSTPRRFKLVLKGYGDHTIELIPNKPRFELEHKLVKGATDSVTRVPDIKPAGTGPATKPDS